MSMLLLGLLLAGAFFGLNVILRRQGNEALYKRVTLILTAIAFVAVVAIIATIQLGFITITCRSTLLMSALGGKRTLGHRALRSVGPERASANPELRSCDQRRRRDSDDRHAGRNVAKRNCPVADQASRKGEERVSQPVGDGLIFANEVPQTNGDISEECHVNQHRKEKCSAAEPVWSQQR